MWQSINTHQKHSAEFVVHLEIGEFAAHSLANLKVERSAFFSFSFFFLLLLPLLVLAVVAVVVVVMMVVVVVLLKLLYLAVVLHHVV